MTVGINFELQPTESNNLRRGRLEFPNKSKSVDTPACMTYTLRGSVPHLLADNTSSLPTDLVQISLEHFLEQKEPSSFKYPFGIHKYLNLQDSIIFCDVRDPRQLSPVSFNTDKYVSVESHGGVRQVTTDLWKEAMTSYRPDVVAPLGDLVTDVNATKKRVIKSVDRTLRWADELLEKSKELGISVFVPVMGHDNMEERARSAMLSSQRNVQGFIINTLGLGSDKAFDYVKASTDNLPQDKPRIAYGLSDPERILEGISNGIDLFDGSYAFNVTEKGRAIIFKFGQDWTETNQPKTLNLWDAAMAHDFEPIDPTCGCHACSRPHSKAYIHHLLNTHEMLGPILLQSHNIYQLDQFMQVIRHSIEQDQFEKYKTIFITRYKEQDDGIHKNDDSIGVHLKKKRAVLV